MNNRDYGLEITAKVVELSNVLLQIMQEYPGMKRITEIGNEIRDIVTAARKEIEPPKHYYSAYSCNDGTNDGQSCIYQRRKRQKTRRRIKTSRLGLCRLFKNFI